MIKAELWIAKQISLGVDFDDLIKLCESLRLQIDSRILPMSVESTLKPSQEFDYLGNLDINASIDIDTDRFPLIHGIVRYLYEYGIGQRVTKKHSCVKTASIKNNYESFIDYICYAILMPWRSVAQDIIDFQKKHPYIDELAYIAANGRKYGEDISNVRTSQYFHRMKQVILLVKESTFINDKRLYY